jgi:hypothetical protein
MNDDDPILISGRCYAWAIGLSLPAWGLIVLVVAWLTH